MAESATLACYPVDLIVELVGKDMYFNELGVNASMFRQVKSESISRMSSWSSLKAIVYAFRYPYVRSFFLSLLTDSSTTLIF